MRRIIKCCDFVFDNAAFTKLALELVEVGAALETDALTERFKTRLKETFDIDEVMTKNISKRESMSAIEEFATNTRKPYVDNRLSDYSEFPDLINYAKSGYRSCVIMPIMDGKRALAILTLLSKQEEKFGNEAYTAILVLSGLFSYLLTSRVEKERSSSLARYFDAAFNSIMPQLLIDKSGSILRANKWALNALEMNQAEISGKNVRDIFGVDANMLASLTGGKSAEAYSSNLGKTFRISEEPINETLRHVLFGDVTSTKMLEDQNKAFDYGRHDAVLILDNNANIAWASGNVSSVLKCQRNSLVGRSLSELIPNQELIPKISGMKEREIISEKAVFKADNDVNIDIRFTMVRNARSFTCIVENALIEKHLESMKSNFDNLVNVSSDMIFFTDRLGYIKMINAGVESTLGYRIDDIKEMALSSFYADKESRERFNNALSIALKEPVAKNIFANMLSKKDIEALPCEQSIERVEDENGDTYGYVVIGRELATKKDIDRLQTENESMQRQIEHLKSESDLKTQFIYNISHDLKTPITNIKGFSSLLYNGEFGELSNDQKGYIKITLDEADRLMSLIQQILDVAKLSSGKIKLDLQETDFSKLGENPSINALVEVMTNKGLAFSWNVDYNVPHVNADPNRLIQVFVNLIGNAIKFTEHGSINVGIFKKGKNIRIEVKDTGIGISKEDQRKLFRKFYQVQRRGLVMQEGAGTGLGLSIAKEIISLHGGRIGVSSEPGKGSTFWFTIPIYGKKKRKSVISSQNPQSQSQQGQQNQQNQQN